MTGEFQHLSPLCSLLPAQGANDGQVKANAPQASTIPWLLLKGRSHQGDGIFSQVNWIQRVHTVGGQAPARSCDRAHENHEVSVGYQADYYFWGVPGNSGVSRQTTP